MCKPLNRDVESKKEQGQSDRKIKAFDKGRTPLGRDYGEIRSRKGSDPFERIGESGASRSKQRLSK